MLPDDTSNLSTQLLKLSAMYTLSIETRVVSQRRQDRVPTHLPTESIAMAMRLLIPTLDDTIVVMIPVAIVTLRMQLLSTIYTLSSECNLVKTE